MIQNKNDLKRFLESDKKALHYSTQNKPKYGRDEIWKYEILLRKTEYYTNVNKGFFSKLKYVLYKYRFHKLSVKLGFSIPLNVFDEGLSIAHYGSIVVNENAKVGKNCRIQENVTIGSTDGKDEAPIIGDDVFIASGARIIGDIHIGNKVSIGANAVVVNSFEEDHITIAGVPARKISYKGSANFNKVD